VSTLHVRLTEFTVGDTGPLAIPGDLPASSGYTYAVAPSADEGPIKIAGKDVLFSQPVLFYQENFLHVPVGMAVPNGYYDNDRAAWVPSPNGKVIKIVGVTGGLAVLDTNGDGVADSDAALATLGISTAERQTLAGLYQPGQSLWRLPWTHFSGFGAGFP